MLRTTGAWKENAKDEVENKAGREADTWITDGGRTVVMMDITCQASWLSDGAGYSGGEPKVAGIAGRRSEWTGSVGPEHV